MGARDGWAIVRDDIDGQAAATALAARAFGESRDELGQVLERPAPSEVIFTGCGSALNVGLIAAPHLQDWAGVGAQAIPASEFLFRPERVLPRTTAPVLVAVSRSGQTTETVLAAETFAARTGGRVVAITCSPGTPLTAAASFTLAVPGAHDTGLPQTRSFTGMTFAALSVAALLADDDVLAANVARAEAVLAAASRSDRDVTEALASAAWTSAVVLGTGPAYGLAREACLKLVEMARVRAEAFPFLEVRHGPNATIGGTTLVVGLLSPESAGEEVRVLEELAGQGALIAACAPTVEQAARLGRFGLAPVDPLVAAHLPFAYLPVLQRLALARARAAGVDPNAPPNVRPFIRIDRLRSPVVARPEA